MNRIELLQRASTESVPVLRKVTERFIQELLAHSDISTTERYLCVKFGKKELALESLVS